MAWNFDFGYPTIWVFLALLVFIAGILYKGIHKTMAKALDDRADAIRKELDEARNLREEAQTLLASFQRKQAEAKEQAEAIVKQARQDAETMAASARKDLVERLERRAELAEAKIKNAEAQAMADVKARAVDLATKAAEQILRSELASTDHNTLVKNGIAEMSKVLN
ncbi:MAG: F0F1 ATP synthase subunit B [Robiginitomaculum sp.]|nr:F0F1 ATP synthase subunit B [Robiginitomaculum sp.]